VGFAPSGVHDPLDTVAYLAWVKQNIPNVYAAGATWENDYWEVVRESYYTQRLLEKNLDYKKYIEEKKTLNTFFITTPKEQGNQYHLDRLKAEVEKTASRFSSPEALNQNIQTLENFLGQKRSQSILSGLIANVSKEDKPKFNGDFSFDALSDYFEKKGGTPAGFKGEAYGIPSNSSLSEVREQYEKLRATEQGLQELKLARYYDGNKELFNSDDVVSISKVLEDSAKSDGFKNALNQYKMDASVASTRASTELELREMPISLGLFKGCVGNECSTASAARFIALPSERVFFIYNPKFPNEPKGTLLVSFLKDAEGKKVMYLKGINGLRVSADDAEAILSQIKSIAKSYGALDVLMPNTHNSLMNHGHLKQIFDNHTNSQVSHELVYPDEELRKLIHPADTHYCDSMSANCKGHAMIENFDEKTRHLKLEVREISAPNVVLSTPSEMDKFEAALRFKFRDVHESIASFTYDELGISPEDIAHFKKALSSHTGTVEELRENLKASARTRLGPLNPAEVEERFEYLVDGALLKCSDGFSPKYETKTSEMFFKKTKKEKLAEDIAKRVKDYPLESYKRRLLTSFADAKDMTDFQLAHQLFTQLNVENHLIRDPVFLKAFEEVFRTKLPLIDALAPGLLDNYKIPELLSKLYLADPTPALQFIKAVKPRSAVEQMRYYSYFKNPEIRREAFPNFEKMSRSAMIRGLANDTAWMQSLSSEEILRSGILEDASVIKKMARNKLITLYSQLNVFCSEAPSVECEKFTSTFKEHLNSPQLAHEMQACTRDLVEILKSTIAP
jgi:hypothetical protein